jgi:hypothetical protein
MRGGAPTARKESEAPVPGFALHRNPSRAILFAMASAGRMTRAGRAAAGALAAGLLCAGCAYTHIRTPLDTDLDKAELGVRQGKSQANSLFGVLDWGDAGTRAAAQNGHITVIRHTDTEIASFLFGLYTRYTTVVYGD